CTGPTMLPAVLPFVSGSKTSLPRMYPPDGVLNVALVDQGPTAPAYTARTRQECAVSNSRAQLGVYETVLPLPPAIVDEQAETTAPAAVLISNSYDNAIDESNLPAALFV